MGVRAPQVFSFFEYSSQCSKRKLRLPMEPLVGMMRHPFVIPVCSPKVRLALTPRGITIQQLARRQLEPSASALRAADVPIELATERQLR